jgi:hypothetical protein
MTREQARRIRRWRKALRSGQYSQGRWRLMRRDKSYCCLGVALVSGCVPRADFADQLAYEQTLARWQLELLGVTEDDQIQLILLNDGARGRPAQSFLCIADALDSLLLSEGHRP